MNVVPRAARLALFLALLCLVSVPAWAEEEPQRGWMGVQIAPLADLERELEYEGDGELLILGVIPESPAATAGLQEGDVLIRVRKREFPSLDLLFEILSDTVVGEKLSVRVWRAGETLDLTLVLGPRPAELREGHEEGEEHEGSERDHERMKLEAAQQEVARALRHAQEETQELQAKILQAAEEGKLAPLRELLGTFREMTTRTILLHQQYERLAEKLQAAKAAPEEHPEVRAARRELEILRLAMKAFLEAEKADAADVIEHAIHARELRLEGKRGEKARKVFQTEPKRTRVGELLVWASKIWAEFGHEEKAAVTGGLGERYLAHGRRAAQREKPASREDRIHRLERRIQELTGALEGLMREIEALRDEK